VTCSWLTLFSGESPRENRGLPAACSGAWAAGSIFLSQTAARDVIDLDVQPRRRRASAHDESGAGLGEREKLILV